MSDYNPYSLSGRTVLVTGASSGIGRRTAIECSKLGATVIITARNEARLAETLNQMTGNGHTSIAADLTRTEQMEGLVDAVPTTDGLVLCAGQGLTSPFLYNTPEKYDQIFQVNLFSPIELLRQLVRKKKLKAESSVVMVSSIAGNGSYLNGNSAYGASKAALNAMMKFSAKELAPKKIRVNSVNPGVMNTAIINRDILQNEQLKKESERYLLKRFGEPRDIALGIIYLLSDAAQWVTGQSLVINGGVTI